MNFQKITEEYYSKWLGREHVMADQVERIHYIQTKERNHCQPGYTKPYDLFGLKQKGRIFISYGNRLKGRMPIIEAELRPDMTSDEIGQSLGKILNGSLAMGIKYVFQNTKKANGDAIVLGKDQYPDFRKFFVNDAEDADQWLTDYYNEMIQSHLCCGVYEDGKLVSCTDAPTIPYMSDLVQEIGINTLEEYRKKGYAADACIACINEIIKNGKCPLWSTAKSNTASQRLAERIGFVPFADYFAVTIEE